MKKYLMLLLFLTVCCMINFGPAFADIPIQMTVSDTDNNPEDISGYQVFRGTTDESIDYANPLPMRVGAATVAIVPPGTTDFIAIIPTNVEEQDHVLVIVVVDRLGRRSDPCISLRSKKPAPLQNCSAEYGTGS